MSRATDQIELGLGLVLGAGLLYGGYKLVKALTPAASDLAGLPGRAAGAVSVALDSSLQAGVNEWNNPPCSDPADPLCVTRAPGKHPLVDENGNPVSPIDEPSSVKAQGRTARIRWGIANSNPKTTLEALNMPGEDLDAESDAAYQAGQRWTPDCVNLPICKGYGGVLLWWGKNVAQSATPKAAAQTGDLATLARFARGEVF